MWSHVFTLSEISFSALARMSGITVQSTHTAVKALTRAGLVRDVTARAGAASVIDVTPEGRRVLDEAMAAVAETGRHLFGPDADPFQ